MELQCRMLQYPPPRRMMLFSHHSHSGQFCKHASGRLEEVVVVAIEKGFHVYGLTEHVPRYRTDDLYPEEAGTPIEQLRNTFDAFVEEAHRLKVLYADRITLLVGLETEFITEEDLHGLEEILHRHQGRIEYIVGSVHHANTIPIDFDQSTFQKAVDSFVSAIAPEPLEHLLLSYFDAQYELLRRFHPEVIGHFDLCRLYRPTLRFREYPDVWAKIERNVRYAIEYGALFELNAAAFRKGWNDAYPASDVVESIKSLGGRFTLSDDSHGPQAVGLNYHRLREYVHRTGLTDLWYLKHADQPNASGRSLAPVLAGGNWCDKQTWGDT